MPRLILEKADQAEEDDAGGNFDNDVAVRANANATASSRWNAGFHFTNVGIADGSVIHRAWMEFSTGNAVVSEAGISIRCEDVDDSADFTTTADVTSRTSTTASTTWLSLDVRYYSLNATVHYCRTPDFTASVQEVVDRDGWSTGNDMMVLFLGSAAVTRALTVQNGTSAGQITPTLNIMFTSGAIIGGLASHAVEMY